MFPRSIPLARPGSYPRARRSDEAVAACRAELAIHGDPQRAAEALTRAAIDDRGSRDNVTVVVVSLRAAPPEPGLEEVLSGDRPTEEGAA